MRDIFALLALLDGEKYGIREIRGLAQMVSRWSMNGIC